MIPKQQFGFSKTAALLASAFIFFLSVPVMSHSAEQPQKTGLTRSAPQESTQSAPKKNKTQLRQSGVSKEIKLITGIKAVVTSEREEKVIFYLNGFYPPKVIVLEGEKPRVVCDFFDTKLDPKTTYPIKVNGNLLRQIRIGIYRRKEAKTRVVLDLNPIHDYDVEQTFFKKENIYVIIVKSL